MEEPTQLSKAELYHYQRQLVLPELGTGGQARLKEASVLIVGAGGLGSPAALYLATAGIGRLGIVDDDVVEVSNLHRQILHTTDALGMLKVDSARAGLQARNPHIAVIPYAERFTPKNALALAREYDVVVDASDNFPTRYLVSDACVLSRTPYVFGSVYQFEGQCSVFAPGGPCYRCLFPESPPAHLVPSCTESGVFGVLPGIVGSLQALEVVKLLTRIGTPLVGQMLLFDARALQFQTVAVPRNPACAACGEAPTINSLAEYEEFCNTSPNGPSVPEISAAELRTRRLMPSAPFVLDVRQPHEADRASLGADRLIPLPELPDHLAELEDYRDRELVVHCQSGERSRRAVQILTREGFTRASSLAGGILAWQQEAGPTGSER